MPKKISAASIQTRIFAQGESIFDFLVQHLTAADLEGSILAVTSKLISLAENRIEKKTDFTKDELIHREAQHLLTEGLHGVQLTITHGVLIPSAGIDESNSSTGDYILYPKDPYLSAKHLHYFLKSHFKLKNFGLILTDSKSSPLRHGVTGIALSHWGFLGTHSLVGEKDLFQKPLKFTHVNVADALAAMAVFCMGEGAEITPIAILKDVDVTYTESTYKEEVQVAPENDLYFPLFKPWIQKD